MLNDQITLKDTGASQNVEIFMMRPKDISSIRLK